MTEFPIDLDAVAPEPAERFKTRLRVDLRAALRARDRDAARALRSVIAAVENAEAVPVDGHAPTVGLATETARRELSHSDVAAALQREIDERQEARDVYRERGQRSAAETLTAELRALAAYLPNA